MPRGEPIDTTPTAAPPARLPSLAGLMLAPVCGDPQGPARFKNTRRYRRPRPAAITASSTHGRSKPDRRQRVGSDQHHQIAEPCRYHAPAPPEPSGPARRRTNAAKRALTPQTAANGKTVAPRRRRPSRKDKPNEDRATECGRPASIRSSLPIPSRRRISAKQPDPEPRLGQQEQYGANSPATRSNAVMTRV